MDVRLRFVFAALALLAVAAARSVPAAKSDLTLPPSGSYAFVAGTNVGCAWWKSGVTYAYAICELGSHGVVARSYGVTISDGYVNVYRYTSNLKLRFLARWQQPGRVRSVPPTRNRSSSPRRSHYTLAFGTPVYVPGTNIACTALKSSGGQQGASCSIATQPTNSYGFTISANQLVVFEVRANGLLRLVRRWLEP